MGGTANSQQPTAGQCEVKRPRKRQRCLSGLSGAARGSWDEMQITEDTNGQVMRDGRYDKRPLHTPAKHSQGSGEGGRGEWRRLGCVVALVRSGESMKRKRTRSQVAKVQGRRTGTD